MPVAPYRRVESLDDVLDAADRVGYPCVVKPVAESIGIFGRKALIAAGRQDLAIFHERRGRLPGGLIVQRYLHGERHCLYFFAANGRVLAAAQTRINRTDRLDGTGYGVDGVSVPLSVRWAKYLEPLLRRLDYSGCGGLQFIRDPESGEETFLEVNARLGGNHAGLELLGMHQPLWWLESLATGEPSIPTPFTYPLNVRYRWFYGDLVGWLTLLRSGTRSSGSALTWGLHLAETLFGPGHLTWNWRDPVPSFYRYGALAKSLLHDLFPRGMRKRRRLGHA
jgi:biotin carboxylase